MNPSQATPMIKQYFSIKEKYTDAILFYRMGDFYEMFFEDAEIASKVLEITLTSRNKKDTKPIPMCGVPARAAHSYIARLIDNGFRVAVCDQVEDPSIAKGLVKRDVVRVITPGMIIEDDLLDEKSNNYILALARNDGVAGISYLDISTGVFRVVESGDISEIFEETLRISPREILMAESSKTDKALQPILRRYSEKSVTYLENRVFDFQKSRERLLEHFKILSLEGFGCERLRAAVSAAGALVYYVQETQKQTVEHLDGIETYSLDNFLMLDDLTCRNLELIQNIRTGSRTGTLLGIIDRTVTALGGRLLQHWLRYPLMNPEDIRLRQQAVSEAKESVSVRKQIRESLKSVRDLERIGSKISMGHANARDFVGLKQSLQMLPSIFKALRVFQSERYQFNEDLGGLNQLADLLEKAIREDAPLTLHEGGMIKTGYHADLDRLIQISRDGKGWLAKLELKEKEATGVGSLKVRYNKIFGYYIEIPKTHSEKAPSHYVRKQTLVNAERYITDELKTYEQEVFGAEERRAVLEYEIFSEIREEILKNNGLIQAVAKFLARLDCLLNLAEIADQNNYICPEITTDGRIQIEDGRHPVVEKMITGERFVPNTVCMDNQDNQILIITGPNMAGKSTVLRQVALLVIMAQMGSFIPVVSATVGLVDRIFTRVGALDNLSQGQSTFMVEMQETANIMNNASPNSLIILDEIGRGTSTFDGLSIAWAVAEYLHDLKDNGVKTLFATHYHELTDLSETKSRVKNYNIAVKEWNDEIIFLRKMVEGSTNRSYGIQVARLAGIPPRVLKRAKKILSNIEKGEKGPDGVPIFAEGEDIDKSGPYQLDLFIRPELRIIQELKNLDVYQMTPLDALNCLNELHEKAKEGNSNS